MPLWSKSGKKSEPSKEGSDSDSKVITETRPEEESAASMSADTPTELSAEEDARLLIYNPPPDTTIVRDFAPWKSGKAPFPERGFLIDMPLTVDEAYSDLIEVLSNPICEVPKRFQSIREQCMYAFNPDWKEWEAQGKPFLPWDDANRDKMLDRLKQARTDGEFSWTYKPSMSQEEKELRELVLSVLTAISTFWKGWGRIVEKSAESVRYDLTGTADWDNKGETNGWGGIESALRPEYDWFPHQGLWMTAAKPQKKDEPPTRMLKWNCRTYRVDSDPIVPRFEWGWMELDPYEQELGDKALKLWTEPLHLQREPSPDVQSSSRGTRTRRESAP